MSSLNDLKSVLAEALENKGVINELKSKLRAEIFTILEDNSFEKPRISQENLLINELIRDYMEFNHYKYSKSVFLKETNQPPTPLNREIIAAELHVKEDKTTKQVPLLYSILWHFLNKDDEESYDLPKTSLSAFQNERKKSAGASSNKNINIYKYNQDQMD